MTDQLQLDLSNWGSDDGTEDSLYEQLGLHGLEQPTDMPLPSVFFSPHASVEMWSVVLWIGDSPSPYVCFLPAVVRRAWLLGMWGRLVADTHLPKAPQDGVWHHARYMIAQQF